MHSTISIHGTYTRVNPSGMLGVQSVIGTLRRAERAVAYRETSEGQRQATVLRQAEQDSGRKRSEIVAELPMEHDQYKRYVRGDTPIKWDQVPQFAAVYGMSPAVLAERLGLAEAFGIAPDPDWNLRAELDRLLPEHPRYAAHLEAEFAGELIATQKSMVEFIRDLLVAGAFSVPPEHANSAPCGPPRSRRPQREEYAV